MFTLETAEIAKAAARARELHPTVRAVKFGLYLVSGSTGNTYTVRCWREGGQKVVDCSCPTSDGIACKHGLSAVPLHSYMATTPLTQIAH
jgi:hypothetical protein